jgi:uncharacterized protein
MPEYLAPGVFVEEVSYRAKSIEGVSTTTTGFIGPTRYGPTDVEPDVLTSLGEFERVYGDRELLRFSDHPPMHNYMWHAVRAFFENGGKRLYVQRVFEPDDSGAGWASASVGTDLTVRSRFPGQAGQRRVRISLELGPNVLAWMPETAVTPAPAASPLSPPGESSSGVLRGLKDRDVVWISRLDSPPSPPSSPPTPRQGEFYIANLVETATGVSWTFTDGTTRLADADLVVYGEDPELSDQVRVVTATVTVFPTEEDGLTQVWSGLPLDATHRSFGAEDSLFHQFHPRPENIAWRRSIPIVVEASGTASDGLDVLKALLGQGGRALEAALQDPTSPVEERAVDLLLENGNDGRRPSPAAYEGDQRSLDDMTGLKAFEAIEDISILAAPGSTYGFENGHRAQASTIIQSLISHVQRMRYRIAVLDSGNNQDISQIRLMKGALDSKHAALYYPWVRVFDPVTQQEISLPPSGFVAGIYARNDVERAVYKAPANEVVTLALGFERTLNKAQQEVLNPEGINCFRFFEGRGNRLWGARTISSDPEWKYVNLRRYFAYLERSIDVGTQWAVFEPNGPALWANVRRTVSDFLFNEFVMGAFLGDKPETSYFVKCDRSTMTQNDIDNGRLVCLVGVAVVKPAEFVIFRIGQWTADAKR